MYYHLPSRHPKYREEWIKFWDVRECQLRARGINVEKYDFTDEWREFFLNRLSILKRAEYEDLKVYLTMKYAKENKRNRSHSESTSRRSRYKSYHNKRSRNSHTSSGSSSYGKKKRRSRSVTPKMKRFKFDVPFPISVISVCRALLKLDKFVSFNRIRVADLLDKAQSDQIKNNREYLMNKAEYEFLKELNLNLLRTLMLKRITIEIADDIKSARKMILDLIERWLQFYDDLKPISPLKNAIIKEEENAASAIKKYSPRRDNYDNYKTPNEGLIMTKKQDETESWKRIIAIKAEPIDRPHLNHNQMLKLMEEKNEILKKIYEEGEIRDPFNLIHDFSPTVNSSDDFKVAIKQEKLSIAHDIPDEQLIEYLSELESLTEEKQALLLQIMTEIETSDQERFDKLKGYIFTE